MPVISDSVLVPRTYDGDFCGAKCPQKIAMFACVKCRLTDQPLNLAMLDGGVVVLQRTKWCMQQRGVSPGEIAE